MGIETRIKTIRGTLSQKEFAEKLGIHITTLQGYEAGNIPKGDILQRMQNIFNVSIDWLLSGEGAPDINDKSLPGNITKDEMALIRTLRLCGKEYKHRVYVAATVRAQRLLEEKRLETKEKLTAQQDLETLSTSAIE